MKYLFVILVSILTASGCAKKKTISPEVTNTKEQAPMVMEVAEENAIEKTAEVPVEIEVVESEIETASGAWDNNSEPEPEPSVEELPEPVEIPEPQTSITRELDFDRLLPDSIWTEYMTKRGDYLSLIAYNEYNNANEWRRIYEWNRKQWEERGIGPDRDNPNFIYPYRELDLKKPVKDAIEWAYDHYIHVVESGETLWTIAKIEYGDELAWVVLFWDNEELLNSLDGKLIPGMKLKVRSELWPEVE